MNLLAPKVGLMTTATIALATASTVWSTQPAHAFKIFTTANETVNNAVLQQQQPLGWINPIPNATTIDFSGVTLGGVSDSLTPLSNSPANGNVQIQDGGSGSTFVNNNLGPVNPASNYLLISPGQTVTLTFGPRQQYFGFYWGKPESGNTARAGQTIEFFKAGVRLDTTFDIATINQRLLNSGVSGSATSLPNNQPIFINFMASNTAELFDTVVLRSASSGGNAFRIDNVAYQIPTPALLPGLLALGVSLRRKRQELEAGCEDSVNT